MSWKKLSTLFIRDAKVRVEARKLHQRFLHVWMILSGIDIRNQVRRFILGCIAPEIMEAHLTW